jgi:hypothetical protein
LSQTKFGQYRRKKGPRVELCLTSNLIILVIAILNTSNVHSGLIGEDQTTGVEVGVTGVEHSVQHGLVQKEVTHPLGDNDINLRERKVNFLHLALEKSNLIGQSIDVDDLTGLLDDRGHIDTNDVLCASTGSKPVGKKQLTRDLEITGLLSDIHAQNTSSTADIEDNLVLEDVAVLVDGVAVRACAHIIFLEGRK